MLPPFDGKWQTGSLQIRRLHTALKATETMRILLILAEFFAPGVIIVSCFDKIRQAVAVESLQRLIADGRMHPSRIEEVVEKVKGEIQEKVVKAGKEAVMEVNLRGLHPKLVETMGKLHYRTSYGQNVLRHSVEVATIAQIIADQLGLDGALARRCGFLHDIGKAMDEDMEGTHPKIGEEFARQYGDDRGRRRQP